VEKLLIVAKWITWMFMGVLICYHSRRFALFYSTWCERNQGRNWFFKGPWTPRTQKLNHNIVLWGLRIFGLEMMVWGFLAAFDTWRYH